MHDQRRILDLLRKEGATYYYPKDKFLYLKGDPADNFYLIDKGSVEIFLTGNDGQKFILNDLRPAEFFGQIEIFSRIPRTTNAWVRAKSELIAIKSCTLREVAKKNVEVAYLLIETLCRTLDKEYEHLEDTLALNSYQRVSKKIYDLSNEDNNNIIDMDQQRMADFLALTRETTNRSLGKLKETGAIAINRNHIGTHIKVLDKGLLQKQFIRG